MHRPENDHVQLYCSLSALEKLPMDHDSTGDQTECPPLSCGELHELLQIGHRSKPLCLAEVKALVNTLRPGLERQANLERYGLVWRLRFSMDNEDGKSVRRSIVINDAATMEWVREYLVWARENRRAYKRELSLKCWRESWQRSIGRELLLPGQDDKSSLLR